MAPPTSMMATAPNMILPVPILPTPMEVSLMDPQVLSASSFRLTPPSASSSSETKKRPRPQPQRISAPAAKRAKQSSNPPASESTTPTPSTPTTENLPELAIIKEVEPVIMTMTDLCRDIPVGEISQREMEMQKIDWVAVKQRRLQQHKDMVERHRRKQAGLPETDDLDGENSDGKEGESSTNPNSKAKRRPKKQAGPAATKIINGNIVLINDSGLEQVDRHAEADAEVATLEEVEEDDLTMFFNRSTWVNQNRRDPAERISQRGNDRWSADQELAFFAGLRMVGTDFSLLSQMIPGKSRRQAKAKFVREERIDPEAIKEALLSGSVPMDFDIYQQACGLKDNDFMDPKVFQEELDQVRATHDLEMERDRLEKQKQQSRAPTVAEALPLPKKRSRAKVASMYGGEEEVVTEFND